MTKAIMEVLRAAGAQLSVRQMDAYSEPLPDDIEHLRPR
jgi:hypothetical protein